MSYPKQIVINVIDKIEAFDIDLSVMGEDCSTKEVLDVLLGSVIRFSNHIGVEREKVIELLNGIRISRIH